MSICFLKLAEEHGIEVVWVVLPISPECLVRCDQLGASAAFDGLLRDHMNRFRNLRVVDGRRSGFPVGYFFDELHFNRTGAKIFTADVAARDFLAAREAGADRWSTLPRFAPEKYRGKIEDISESRASIGITTPPTRR